MDALTLARELIRIPSITEEEFEVGQYLYETLRSIGLSPQRQEVSQRRFNLFAPARGRPRILLCSHIDTVPPFLDLAEDADHIYGRGACDTKGIIAAMLVAASRLIHDGVRDFAVLLVVGEETDSAGAKLANRELAALGSEFVLVGEPTDSRFARASKGALTCTVHFEGVAAHSAYPERGDSAIRKMAEAIGALYASEWGEDPNLGKATVNVGVVRGGVKPNVIAGQAEMQVMFRTAGDPAIVEERLRGVVAPLQGRIVKSQGNPPMFMRAPEGYPSTVVAFNTDIPYLRNLGAPILFGPGSILDAHGAAEKIVKRDVVAAVEVYHRVVSDILSGRVRWQS